MRRLTLIGGAIPLGLATALTAWVLAGGLSVRADDLDAIHDRLTRLKAPTPAATVGSDAGASVLLSAPLFALTTGPGAVREPAVRVDGVSLTRRRMAALVSIDARPAEWLSVGETRDGLTLQSMTASSVTFETALGVKTLNLGEQSAASAPLQSASTSSTVAPTVSPLVQDQVPPGFRSPPEPASAPR